MKQIKNLKINWKKTVSVLLTATIITTLSGCCLDNHEEIIEEKNNTISSLEQENLKLQEQLNELTVAIEEKNKIISSLEQEKLKLQEQLNELTVTQKSTVDSEDNVSVNDLSEDAAIHLFYENGVLKVDSIGKPHYLKYYDDAYGGPDHDGDGHVQEIIKNGKKYLVDANDFSKVLLSEYESIGEPYYLKYYNYDYGGSDHQGVGDGYVQEIIKNGKKYLVDANDFSKVLLSEYESIGEPYYLKYYDDTHGGPDHDGDGHVQEIIKNGKKYLVDANDFSKVLLSEYESIGKPYYLKYYDDTYGGLDHSGSGHVQEIIKNGRKYLVDANDFSAVLASDYTSIRQNNLNTTIVFADGHTEVYTNKDLKPSKSYILTK